MAGLESSNVQSTTEVRMPAGVTDWDNRSSGAWTGHTGDHTKVQLEQWRCSVSGATSVSSSVVGCLPLPSGGRQQAVEDLLQANARLLQKLAE
jgi:hypothetical protein